MAYPSSVSAGPLSSLGEVLEDLDPETLALIALEQMTPGGAYTPTGEYDFLHLKYPENIEHFFMHGHYINFFINVPVTSKYWTDDEKTQYSYKTVEPTGLSSLLESYPPTYNEVESDYFGEELPHAGGFGGSVNYYRTKRISQAISLYIPDSITYSSTMMYENTSLVGESGKLVGNLKQGMYDLLGKDSKFASTISQTVGMASNFLDAAKTVGGMAGFALNENLLVLFRGMGLRDFSYEFYFSPKSLKESMSIQNIIKAFRFHAHPEINQDYGLFYVAPGTFDIELMHKGGRNNCIHKVSTCVLVNVDVDYAPYGWSTHKDGMPVQTRMTLHFKETEVMTKQKIEDGF